jgi:hypothetical protein
MLVIQQVALLQKVLGLVSASGFVAAWSIGALRFKRQWQHPRRTVQLSPSAIYANN